MCGHQKMYFVIELLHYYFQKINKSVLLMNQYRKTHEKYYH
jgi:hypothetical protein